MSASAGGGWGVVVVEGAGKMLSWRHRRKCRGGPEEIIYFYGGKDECILAQEASTRRLEEKRFTK